jgi:hypothetical protein
MAFIGHLILQSLLEPDNHESHWKGVTIECKLLTFAAPMSVFDVNEVGVFSDCDNPAKERAKSLMDTVSRNACNVVYGCEFFCFLSPFICIR